MSIIVDLDADMVKEYSYIQNISVHRNIAMDVKVNDEGIHISYQATTSISSAECYYGCVGKYSSTVRSQNHLELPMDETNIYSPDCKMKPWTNKTVQSNGYQGSNRWPTPQKNIVSYKNDILNNYDVFWNRGIPFRIPKGDNPAEYMALRFDWDAYLENSKMPENRMSYTENFKL